MNDYGLHRERTFSPWRPGSTHLAVVQGSSTLKVIDSAVLTGISVSRRQNDALLKAPALHSICFENLAAGDRDIMRFQWHSSGDYLAMNVSDAQNPGHRRIHVVHVKSGEIVKTIAPPSLSLGWSPSGRHLLYQLWEGAYTDNWEITVGWGFRGKTKGIPG